MTTAGMLDGVSFNALLEYCRDQGRQILIVDPNPTAIAGYLQEELRNRNVTPIPAYWDLLSQAILDVCEELAGGDLRKACRFSEEIARRYNGLLE